MAARRSVTSVVAMLLAEELALIALDPESGRPAFGTRDNLNACLAGLLVAELQLDDRPAAAILDAASEVVEDAPKLKSALSAMSRGLARQLGVGTWEAVLGGRSARYIASRVSACGARWRVAG